MKSRGILMTTPMVQALQKGTKTETRRDVGLKRINENPDDWTLKSSLIKDGVLNMFFLNVKTDELLKIKCPYGIVGDGLWVRETFVNVTDPFQTTENVLFKADSKTKRLPDGTFKDGQLVYNWESDPKGWKWQPSLFMLRIASRFDLEITELKCERLQDITEGGAIAEGISELLPFGDDRFENYSKKRNESVLTAIESYLSLFEFVNTKNAKKKGFQENPWVWVIKFKDVTKK